jgi:D-alanyl-D-alanine carboxypeptidase
MMAVRRPLSRIAAWHFPRSLPRLPRSNAIALLAVGLVLLASLPAQAQIGSSRYSSIVIEASGGRVLSSVNADELRHPASLTKMMTLYMVFEALRDRRISLDQSFPVSAAAAAKEPSKLGLLPGSRITVEQAILGLVTKSANDAAAALGELLGGDEQRFAQMMTLRARALGMTRTTFRNASGLPDPAQVTTARDLALLGRRLVQDFPTEYRYFSVPAFTFRGRVIYNHDHLLQSYPGADGIKTGYIEAAGHNLVTSAVRGDVRLVGVVLGAGSNPERDTHMASLLDSGFEQMDVPTMRHEPSHGIALVASAQAATATLRSASLHAPRPLTRWAVQVGAFGSEAAARQAATAARRIADGGSVQVEHARSRGHSTWRAQLTGLTPADARDTCATLARRHKACFTIRPDAGQVASR